MLTIIPHIALSSKVLQVEPAWTLRGVLINANVVEHGDKWLGDIKNGSTATSWQDMNTSFLVLVGAGLGVFFLAWWALRRRYLRGQ